MAVDDPGNSSSAERLQEQYRRLEERLREAGVSEDPTIKRLVDDIRGRLDRHRETQREPSSAQKEVSAADDLMRKPWIKAPDVAAAFDRARNLPEREAKKPEAKLEYNPPGPAPTMGQGQERPAQVSPQLRAKEQRQEKLRTAMRMKREFNRAARDPIDR